MASLQPTPRDKKPLTWLITGCSSGFGLQLARHAQSKGHHIIASSRNPARTPDLVDEITRGSEGSMWIKLDQDERDCGRAVDELEARGIAVDVLVNSAGIGAAGPVEAFAEDEVRALMETNFFGPYRLMRAVVPHMRRRRAGVVVNLSSGSGLGARPNLGVYGASKAALDNLTRTLAAEVSSFNVRVLLVYMGTFNTAMPKKTGTIKKAPDDDYKGTDVEAIYNAFSTGDFPIPGDHKKACKAIYEVAAGEGVGVGKEKEVMMVLGKDCFIRAQETRDHIDHMMEVFGDIAHNVDVD